MRHTRYTQPTRHSRRTTGLLAAGLLLTVAACGDDGDGDRVEMQGATAGANPDQFVDDPPADPDEADQTGADTDAATVAPEEQTTEVGAEFWYAGFRVDVEEARLLVEEPEAPTDDFGEPAEPAVTVEVETVVENTLADDEPFRVDEVDLNWSGGTVTSEADLGDEVRAGSTARVVHLFEVDETFTFDDATLTAGGEDTIQPVVPLSDPGAAFTAAPIPLEGANETEPGPVFEIEITDLVLRSSPRWTNGGSHGQNELDQPSLLVAMNITNISDDHTCIYDFRLELPDGTEIGVDGENATEYEGCLDAGVSATGAEATFPLADIPFDPTQLSGETYAVLLEDARAPFELTAAPGQDTGNTGESDDDSAAGAGSTGAGSEPAEAGEE